MAHTDGRFELSESPERYRHPQRKQHKGSGKPGSYFTRGFHLTFALYLATLPAALIKGGAIPVAATADYREKRARMEEVRSSVW
jgi:hypothetical protein